jgi:hypothetical protein
MTWRRLGRSGCEGKGRAFLIPNPHTDIYPMPNFKAQVVLNHNLQDGVVHYQYLDSDQQWQAVTGAIKQVELT